MKMMKFFLLAAAAVAAISCAKELSPIENETPAPEVELVPMTFTASHDAGDDAETKVAYEGGATVWQVGDKIMVIASTTGTAREFEATSVSEDGKTATFDGLTEAGEETFYAVYPASAYKGEPTDVTTGKNLYVNIPATQQAVAGTFDPNAILCTANNKGNVFSFKQACAFLKFHLENPEGIKNVRLKVNNSDNIAGVGYMGINEVENPEHRYATTDPKLKKYDMITLNAPEGGFVAGEDYIIAMRANSCPTGVTFYVEYEDGVKSRATSNRVFPAQNPDDPDQVYGSKGKIRNLGQLDIAEKLSDVTPYDSYQMGYDINIAGRKYNKTKLGNAIKISDPDFVISENGVYFIDETATNLKVHKDGTLNKLYIIANKNDQKLPITFGRDLRYGKNGTVALKNMAIAPLTTTELFIHNNDNEISTLVALDGCKVTMSGKNIITNANTRTVDTFLMHNCDVEVNTDGLKVIAAGDEIKNVEFVNNIFYSATDRKNFKLYDILSNATSNVTNFKFISNSFINVYLNPNGLITPSKLTGSFVNEQNLFEYPNYMTVVNSTYRTMLRCGDAVENYPVTDHFKWAAGWFYIGNVETPDSKYGIKSSYKVVNDAVSPQNSSGFKSLSFDPVLTFTKAYNAGATR